MGIIESYFETYWYSNRPTVDCKGIVNINT